MCGTTITDDHKRLVCALGTLHQGERATDRMKAISEVKKVSMEYLLKLVVDLKNEGLVERNVYSVYTLTYKGREYFCNLNGIDYEEYTKSLKRKTSEKKRPGRKIDLLNI